MKKSRFLWGGVVLAALLVLSVFFLGRAPFAVPVWKALPVADRSTPHLILVGKGEDIPSRDFWEPLEESLPVQSVTERFDEFLPLLGRMDQFAFVILLKEGVPGVHGAFYLPVEDLGSLRKGELPAGWGKILPDATVEKGEGGLSLAVRGRNFALRLKDRMVLLSDRAEKLDLMESILEKEAAGMEPVWSLHPEWSTHLRIYDAGSLGDILFMAGVEAGTAPLSVEASWRNGMEGHDLAWKFDGVGDLLSEWGFSEKRSARAWARPMTLSSPSLLTFGLDLPPEFLRRFRGDIEPEWADDLRFSPSQTDALLSGPMVFSLGGRSRMFLFTAPGVYLQLFDRGDLARDLVDRLWNGSWSTLAERRETLRGFSSGGGVSRPFSVVGAAGKDRAIVGLLDPQQVEEESTPARFLPFDPAGSFFWFYGDFPELASTLKKWARLGAYARNVGFEVGEMKETFDRIERLRSMGRLTLALRNPFEGWASWTGNENR